MQRIVKRNIFVVTILVISFLAIYKVVERVMPKEVEVEPEIVLCYGEVNPEGHVMTETAHYFAECVKELSKGKMLIEIYPSGQLGDDVKCYEALKMGALDLYRGNSASLTGTEMPMISIMALPYLFDDSEHFWKVCNSELGNRILNNIKESCKGMRGIAFVDEGARNFFSTDNPITKLEDLSHMNFRIQVSDIMIDTVLALGAKVTPIEYVELYTALKEKSIDGAENPLISYYYNKFYEVAPYYVKDEHTYSPGVILISEITWEKLGEEYQSLLMEAASLTQEYNKREINAAEQKAYEAILKSGVTITEISDPKLWRIAVEPVYQKYGAKFNDIINEIKNMR